MEITVSGRRIEITDMIREYAENKVKKLPRYFDRIGAIEVIVDRRDNHSYDVEIIVKAEHVDPFVGSCVGNDVYACVDDVVEKLERRLTDHKGRLRDRKRKRDDRFVEDRITLKNSPCFESTKTMRLSDCVIDKAIVPQLASTQRDKVITELIDALVDAGALTKSLRDELIKMIVNREKEGSTGFGKGVAVPHAKHMKIKKMVAAIGVSQQGLDFNALDKAPVYSVVLLLSPKDKPDEHLQVMENIFVNLQNDTFRRFLRQATDLDAVTGLLQEADAQQLQG